MDAERAARAEEIAGELEAEFAKLERKAIKKAAKAAKKGNAEEAVPVVVRFSRAQIRGYFRGRRAKRRLEIEKPARAKRVAKRRRKNALAKASRKANR